MTDNTHKALAAKMCRDESHAYAQLVAEEKAHASQPINQPTEGLEDRARTQGWNAACDALCNWLNSLDTEDMGINDLRSAVYGWCQENVGQVAAAPIDGLAGQLEKALNQADKRLVAGENTTLIAGWIADFCRNHREVILARLSQPSPSADVVEAIASFVEGWNGKTADGNTSLIAFEIRERFTTQPQDELAELQSFRDRVMAAIHFDPGADGQAEQRIVADLRDGLSLRKCATKHGVGMGVVRGIKKRRIDKHLQESKR